MTYNKTFLEIRNDERAEMLKYAKWADPEKPEKYGQPLQIKFIALPCEHLPNKDEPDFYYAIRINGFTFRTAISDYPGNQWMQEFLKPLIEFY